MGLVRRKATTSRPKLFPAEFKEKKQSYLEEIVGKIHMHDIPHKHIINCDQTGINVLPTSNWTLESKGAKRVLMQWFK